MECDNATVLVSQSLQGGKGVDSKYIEKGVYMYIKFKSRISLAILYQRET